MIVAWTGPARADLLGVINHIRRDNPAAAVAMAETLEAKAELLADHPKLGHRGRRRRTREFVAHARYILIYSVTPTAVRILRVMHTARDWPPRG